MTQLLRMQGMEEQLSETEISLAEKKKYLENERKKSNIYQETLENVQTILYQDVDKIEIPTALKQSQKLDENVNKRVTFKETLDVKEYYSDSKEKLLPLCLSYSMLGDCTLESAGKCQKRHSGNICFQFRDRGQCSWKEKCKFRHPIEYRLLRRRNKRQFLPVRRPWFPRQAPTSSWRKRQQSQHSPKKISRIHFYFLKPCFLNSSLWRLKRQRPK